MFSSHAKTGLKTLIATVIGFASFQNSADVVISGTRITYQQSMEDVIVDMTSHGQNPLLLQIWIDGGRTNVSPQELKLPFVITLPITRMDPGKGRPICITYLNRPLAQDQESLFWLNALEIPKKSA